MIASLQYINAPDHQIEQQNKRLKVLVNLVNVFVTAEITLEKLADATLTKFVGDFSM